MSTANQQPPGERVGFLPAMKVVLSGEKFDQLAYARHMSDTYGGFAYTLFANLGFYTITDPELFHEILVERADEFNKGIITNVFRPVLGNGLLTSEGDFWKRQRKLAQPAFHYRRIESYGQIMAEDTLKLLESWQDGQTRLIDREMMKLTLSIVCKTLFDADVSGDAERVGELMEGVLDAANERTNAAIRLPDWMPTPKRVAQKKLIAELDAIIQRFINERRKTGEDRGDLLSMLLLAQDDEGKGMTDKQLRDEVTTLFLAGHETTANTLTWAFYLLAENPEARAKLYAEVDQALDGRAPTLADLKQMPYTEMVIKETMRLYPAAPGLSRAPNQDLQLRGYTIRKDAIMQLSMYAMHRSARYFENPDAFIPERFTPENEKQLPRYAYLPFGAGPRVCIGNSFAMMEARLILAAIVSRFNLALVPGQDVVAEQLMTLRPKDSIQMRVQRREYVAAGNPVEMAG